MDLDSMLKWSSLASNIVTVLAFALAGFLAAYEGPSYFKRRRTEKLEKLYELANEFEYATIVRDRGPAHPDDFDDWDFDEAEKECHQARWALSRYFANNKHSFKGDPELEDIVQTATTHGEYQQVDDLTRYIQKLLQS